jgi:hypothetical protein
MVVDVFDGFLRDVPGSAKRFLELLQNASSGAHVDSTRCSLNSIRATVSRDGDD